MKPLDELENDSENESLLERLSIFALPLFGLIGAFLFPILLVLLIGFVVFLLGLFLN